MGCAASYAEQYNDGAVVAAAAVAKLTRNVFLAAVVPLMAVRHAAGGGAGLSAKTGTRCPYQSYQCVNHRGGARRGDRRAFIAAGNYLSLCT